MTRGPIAIVSAILVGVACGTRPAPPREPPVETPKVAASTAPVEAASATSAEPSAAVVEEVEEAAAAAPAPSPVCNPQQPFEFLVRKNYIPVKQKAKEHEKAVRYRTVTYGYVKGFGDPAWNPKTPKDSLDTITLFGLQVTVHKKIVPALRCAEAEVKASCSATPYTPSVLSGIRDYNTYRGGEVTNHMYGIALDLDPKLNSCCGCVKKWQQSPLCKKKVKTIWERMAMPKCWVEAFEKYGFYWLGHDKLQDTMHFEFLADPDKIMVTPAPSVVTVASAAN